MVYVVVIMFGSDYITSSFFIKDKRYVTILKTYGTKPRKKDLWIGFFAYLFAVLLGPLWGIFLVVIWDMNH